MNTFEDFSKLMHIKGYATSTINAYRGLLIAFQKFLGPDQHIHLMDNYQVNESIARVVPAKNLASGTHKQLIAALNLYFKEMHHKMYDFKSVYPIFKPQQLPVVLSVQEVKRILNSSKNLKHTTMLTLVYALGLRSGELINLRFIDIDKNRQQIHIKNSKNNKDRILPFTESLRSILIKYYREYQPKEYLFEGQNKAQYNPQSLRKVFQIACKKASIKKKVTLHSLRHAYATHLMDAGTDVRIIKELLGHNSIKTTMIYTHVTTRTLENLPNPLDFIK